LINYLGVIPPKNLFNEVLDAWLLIEQNIMHCKLRQVRVLVQIINFRSMIAYLNKETVWNQKYKMKIKIKDAEGVGRLCFL
jgi:hypothetical protein